MCLSLQTYALYHVLTTGFKSTFIIPPVLSGRFASASSLQYHQLLPSLAHAVAYIQEKICPSGDSSCHQYASSLLSVDYLDVDYDSISHALTLNAFWSRTPGSAGWTERISKGQAGSDSVEVGLLTQEASPEVEELKLSGFLTVVGEDSKPSLLMHAESSGFKPLTETQIPHSSHFPPATTLSQPTRRSPHPSPILRDSIQLSI